jgi:hypothetical protein
MTEAVINGIFPTPIYMSKLDRALTPLELKFVDKSKKDFYKNDGNITSNNNYILNEKPFTNIKKELDLRVQDYLQQSIINHRCGYSLHYTVLVKLHRNQSISS